MIGRLLDRVPEAWAERWARRLNLVHIAFMLCFLVTWWFLGLRVLATRHMNLGAATFCGFAWVPTMMTWLIVQGIHTHHQFRRSRETFAALNRTHEDISAHAERVHHEIDAYRRREMGLPPVDERPAVH